MNDDTQDIHDDKSDTLDITSAAARGFDPGDDDKLQAAIRENLEAVHAEHVEMGREEDAASVKEHLEALDKLHEIEKREDPHDEVPDDPTVG